MIQERPFAEVARRFREFGLRPTRQRMALARLLFGADDRHVTAEQLHQEASERGIKVSSATVYNTLHLFTEAGLLREVAVDGTRTYFDTNTRHHYHFYDEVKGMLTDIPADAIRIAGLPTPPDGRCVERVDVVVRVSGKS